MKKAEIIKSKHVDHIENEKNILEKLQHPFVVSSYCSLDDFLTASSFSWIIMDFYKMKGTFTSLQNYWEEVIYLRITDLLGTLT